MTGTDDIDGLKGHVLVVEDSMHTRNIFKYLFRQNGFSVSMYKTGAEAWQYLTSTEIPNLRLVFSDVMMPEMTGIELIEKMRSVDKYKETPVILVTAVTDREIINKAKDLSVKAYMLKPVSATKIIECLKKVFPNDHFIDIDTGV